MYTLGKTSKVSKIFSGALTKLWILVKCGPLVKEFPQNKSPSSLPTPLQLLYLFLFLKKPIKNQNVATIIGENVYNYDESYSKKLLSLVAKKW